MTVLQQAENHASSLVGREETSLTHLKTLYSCYCCYIIIIIIIIISIIRIIDYKLLSRATILSHEPNKAQKKSVIFLLCPMIPQFQKQHYFSTIRTNTVVICYGEQTQI